MLYRWTASWRNLSDRRNLEHDFVAQTRITHNRTRKISQSRCPPRPVEQKVEKTRYNFLKSENKIKEWELGSYVSHFLMFHDIIQFKLKLESLNIEKYNRYCFASVEIFLTLQSPGLKKLDLGFINTPSLKLITEKMILLESLKLSSFNLLSRQFDGYIQQNPAIKELALKSFSIQTMKLLLNIMPNVSTLRLSWATDKELEVIVNSGKRLINFIWVKTAITLGTSTSTSSSSKTKMSIRTFSSFKLNLL